MSAREKIAAHLAKGKTITPAQALAWYGTFSLSQHISALKRKGMKIGAYIVPGKRFARYYAVGR
jgi:hypothetical protein